MLVFLALYILSFLYVKKQVFLALISAGVYPHKGGEREYRIPDYSTEIVRIPHKSTLQGIKNSAVFLDFLSYKQ